MRDRESVALIKYLRACASRLRKLAKDPSHTVTTVECLQYSAMCMEDFARIRSDFQERDRNYKKDMAKLDRACKAAEKEVRSA